MNGPQIAGSFFLCSFLILGTAHAQKPLAVHPEEMIHRAARNDHSFQMRMNDNPLLDEYDVAFYGIDVEVSTESDRIKGNATVLVRVQNNPLSTLLLELSHTLEIEKILVDGLEQSFTHEGDEISIPLSDPADPGQLVSAQVFYGGETGEGMQNERDPNWDIPVTFTQSEPFYAKDWFPCKEDLADKADSVHVFVTTGYGLMAASNGIYTGTTYFPNGKVRHEWKTNYPIAFYLISIAVSDYMEYNLEAPIEGISEPVFIQNFLYDKPGCLETYREQIDVTSQIMQVFWDLFGPYPFREEKYGHYLWPWGGGMEHQTMTGMGDFNFSLVAHELGHSWFGDYVTCATWQDIWINEGFATYAANLATQELGPEFARGEREYWYGRALNEPDGSVFVPAIEADSDPRIFSGNLSYGKGMALVHMIRYELQNDSVFFQTLRTFIDRHANDVATGMDFKAVLEETSGMDFTDFFNQWYFGYGYPVFQLNWDQQGADLTLQSTQTTSSGMTTLFKTSLEFKLFYPGGDSVIRVFQNENQETFQFLFNHPVDSIQIDPDDWILNAVAGIEGESAKKSKTTLFTLFPNPNSGRFSFRLNAEDPGDVTVEVFNRLGQRVGFRVFKGNLPYADHEVNLSHLTEGLYFVRLGFGTRTELKKIIVK